MVTDTPPKRFRIAFSFAGEKRPFVEQTAQLLAEIFGKEKILYDKYHEAEFARFNLGIYLPKLYGEQSELIVPVLCQNYDQKRWTGWEWLHIYSLLTKADGHRVMPSRFDDADAGGLSDAAGFIELDQKTPDQFATLILQRLALNEGLPKNHYLDQSLGNQAAVWEQTPLQSSLDAHHKLLTLDALANAKELVAVLQADFARENPTELVPNSARAMVDYFSNCAADRVQDLFYMVRRALKALEAATLDHAAKQRICEAASALYCLAALRLVDNSAHQPLDLAFGVPGSENVVCAIIATALFGGKLQLKPTEANHLPCLEFVYSVQVGRGGEQLQVNFERALHTAIFQNDKDAGLAALDDQPLSEKEVKRLNAQLREIKHVERDCLALIVQGCADSSVAKPFADKHRIPVMFPSNEATSLLLGMDADELREEIGQFWKRINQLRVAE
ncbi:hypothetical protein HC024_01450 [Methylococcaceae bacterium WWC4]|nr:hypothetical protein [Methylococcaceae bacterium WWC4]